MDCQRSSPAPLTVAATRYPPKNAEIGEDPEGRCHGAPRPPADRCGDCSVGG